VTDLQYVVTFAVMLIIALTLANLMVSVRLQTRIAGIANGARRPCMR